MADAAEPNATPPAGPSPPPAPSAGASAENAPATPPAPAAAAQPQVPQFVIRNRIPGNGGVGQNNLINVRERLFHEIYFKVALIYAQLFPAPVRKALEYFILFKAIVFFAALVYLHMAFIKNPATCLQHVKDWPRDGVLRVEVIPHLEQQRAIIERSRSYEKLVMDLEQNYFHGVGPQTKSNHYLWRRYEQVLREAGYELQTTYVNNNETIMYYVSSATTSADVPKIPATSLQLPPVQNANGVDNADEDEQYVVEYALEYGHLRLSAATRKRLHIPVRVVQLDPMKDKCFGDSFSKFMLRKVLGYDDLLMASVRIIAEQEDNKGYLRNVVTGEHYRFVSMWWAAWSSYPTAFSVMLLFTFSISMLLRFSHHQIFVFIVDLLQMLEFNVTARFPIAPLLTVILALVGMEAIMSEFFNDATTAFYIILIVWIADQYDAICCHTTITKRHWLRFFYLYHFAFYAYHYRFSGQNRNLSLITSWLFIQHSMVFFFHRYELPVIVQQAQIIILTRNQPNGAGGANANAVNADAATAGAGGGVAAEGAAGQQQQLRQRIFFFRQQQVRLPLLGVFSLGNRPLNWESIQRAFLQRGWRANLPVRIQIGNVHGINVRSMQHNAARLAAAAAVAATVQNARGAGENADGNDVTPPSTSTTSSDGNAFVPNAADEVTSTTENVPVEHATRSSATDIESNEKATTSPTPTLSSSEGHHDVKPSQSGEHQNTATGNNHVEQPETVKNNKIEDEVAHEQREKQENNNDNIMKHECYDAAAAVLTTATTKQENQDEPITMETIKPPTAANKQEATFKNEQLENDLYVLSEDVLQANTTESNQAPQQSVTISSSPVAATAAARASEVVEYTLLKENGRNGLTANSADMLQAINQVNIETGGLSNDCNVVATTRLSVARDEKFDMIDSNERHQLTQDDVETCSHTIVCDNNNSHEGNNNNTGLQQHRTLVDNDREKSATIAGTIHFDSDNNEENQLSANFIAHEAAYTREF